MLPTCLRRAKGKKSGVKPPHSKAPRDALKCAPTAKHSKKEVTDLKVGHYKGYSDA